MVGELETIHINLEVEINKAVIDETPEVKKEEENSTDLDRRTKLIKLAEDGQLDQSVKLLKRRHPRLLINCTKNMNRNDWKKPMSF